MREPSARQAPGAHSANSVNSSWRGIGHAYMAENRDEKTYIQWRLVLQEVNKPCRYALTKRGYTPADICRVVVGFLPRVIRTTLLPLGPNNYLTDIFHEKYRLIAVFMSENPQYTPLREVGTEGGRAFTPRKYPQEDVCLETSKDGAGGWHQPGLLPITESI